MRKLRTPEVREAGRLRAAARVGASGVGVATTEAVAYIVTGPRRRAVAEIVIRPTGQV